MGPPGGAVRECQPGSSWVACWCVSTRGCTNHVGPISVGDRAREEGCSRTTWLSMRAQVSQVVLLHTAHSWANAGVLLGARIMHRERGSFQSN